MNLKIFAKNIEEQAINQINELLKQETFKDSKVRIMPDVHAGKGCVIGFTGNLGKKSNTKHCWSRYRLWNVMR